MSAAAPGRWNLLSLHRGAIHAIIVADLCFSSRLYMALLPDIAQRLLLSTLLLTGLAYLGLALMRGYVVPVLLFVVAAVLIIGQMMVYEMNWGMTANPAGAAQYTVILTFIVFFIVGRDGLSEYAINTLAVYALGYVCFYIAYVAAYFSGLLPPSFTTALLLNDADRGDRFFAYAGALSFSWYVALSRVRERRTQRRVAVFGLCVLANVLTLSRVYLACLAAVTAMELLRLPRAVIRIVCIGSLFFISAVLLYGLIDTRWNPFFAFSSNDASGLGRGLEYQIAQDLLMRSPILGLGLSSSPEQPGLLTGISFFSPGDLGMAGVMLDFGVVGLSLFLASSWIACTRLPTVKSYQADALNLTGCTLAMYGCIAPILFVPGGAFYFAAILGTWLSAGQGTHPETGRSGSMATAHDTASQDGVPSTSSIIYIERTR